jgi:hypothetical protein
MIQDGKIMFETLCRIWYSPKIARLSEDQGVRIVIASLIFAVVLTPLALIVLFISGWETGASALTYLTHGFYIFLSAFVIAFAGCMMGWN